MVIKDIRWIVVVYPVTMNGWKYLKMLKKKTNLICPHCKNDDQSMMEELDSAYYVNRRYSRVRCDVCSKEWTHDEVANYDNKTP